MTKTTLDKMTITEDEIDNYVDTLTNTITSAIAEKVPTKTIKRNPIGLPIEIRELIRQKIHQRRLWQRTRIPQQKTNANRLQQRMFTAAIWSFPKVKVPPGVKSGQS